LYHLAASLPHGDLPMKDHFQQQNGVRNGGKTIEPQSQMQSPRGVNNVISYGRGNNTLRSIA
jgi:hypothetical protein